MTMKERLAIHKQIVKENERKLDLWKRYEFAKKCLGFYPHDEVELLLYECNGYDDGILMYR